MSELPKNWEKSTIGDAYSVIGGGTPSTSEGRYWNGTIPWITSADIHGVRDIEITRFVSEEGIANSTTNKVPARTLLVVTRVGLGKIAIALGDICFSQDLQGLVQSPDVIWPEYALYFLSFELQKLKFEGRGTTISGITKKQLKDVVFPLPPLNEQKRIVAKIEELFSELDSGIESLNTARAQLKVYRQAVLKHAFEAKLTAAWREKNKDKLESAEQLLKRMGTERIKQADLADLPASWAWIKSAALFSMVTSGSRGWAKYYSDSGALFIRIGNLDFDSLKLDLSDIQYVSPPASAEGSRTRVQEGDFLFSITGYLGMFALAPQLNEAYVNQHIALARPVEGFNKEYVGYYITSKTGGHYYLNGLTKGAVKAGLRLDDIRSFPVPMCSIAEQEEIVAQIKQKLSVIENLEKNIDLELQKSEALRQSILKKAFSGQLVAQDAKDEPASALLERIRANKTGVKPAKISKKAAKKSPARAATIIAFPNTIASITTTDLHAGIIGLAYNQHEQNPRMLNTFGHVKAEKISHLVEYHLGIPLGRAPVKDAAGPNDYRHLKKVEHRANMANWFSVQQRPGGEGYVFAKKRGFDGLIAKTSQALGEKAAEVEALIRLLLPLNTQQAEIVATLYAAWNNLLIAGSASPSDEEIVTEARENWYESKLNIERDRFFRGLEWLRKKQLTPKGMGTIVNSKTGRHNEI